MTCCYHSETDLSISVLRCFEMSMSNSLFIALTPFADAGEPDDTRQRHQMEIDTTNLLGLNLEAPVHQSVQQTECPIQPFVSPRLEYPTWWKTCEK